MLRVQDAKCHALSSKPHIFCKDFIHHMNNIPHTLGLTKFISISLGYPCPYIIVV